MPWKKHERSAEGRGNGKGMKYGCVQRKERGCQYDGKREMEEKDVNRRGRAVGGKRDKGRYLGYM